MKIIKQEEYPLLMRKQIEFEFDHKNNKTISKEEALKEVSSSLKIAPELIKIKVINTKYGSNKSKIIANVYDNTDKLKSIEEFRKKPKQKKEKKAQVKK